MGAVLLPEAPHYFSEVEVKHDAISALLRHAVEQPYYLADDERLEVRSSTASGVMLEETADEVRIWGAVMKRDTYDVVREAGVTIAGQHLRAIERRGSKGAFVDLVCSKLDELYDLLEPEPLPDDLMQLAMAAFSDQESCDVLADALLEREAIKPPYRGLRKRADTRTDEERAADLRAELHRKAKAWARPYVEILFRRHWSTKPWAFWEFDTRPGAFFGIDRTPGPLRLAGLNVTSISPDEIRDAISRTLRRLG